MKVKLLSVLILFMLFSCSKDDGEPSNKGVNSATWNITVGNVYASQMEYEMESYSIYKDFDFGYRKKNGAEIYPFPSRENNIGGLEPLTEYEIFIYNSKTNEVSDKKVAFRTLPFDVLDYTGYKVTSKEASELSLSTVEGYTHAIGLKNITSKAINISGKLISVDSDEVAVPLEDFEIKNDSLILTIPKDVLSNEPFELYEKYNIEYTIGNYRAILNKEINGKDYNLNFLVYNDDPYIDTLSVNKGAFCFGKQGYEFFLKGYFMSKVLNPLGNIDNDKITAVITRVDDDSLILIQGVKGSNDKCQTFVRLWSKNNLDGFFETNYHLHRDIQFQMIESEDGMHPGDYTIRFTFDKNGEYFETNEYTFTVPE